MNGAEFSLIYIGRSRLQRNRANLLQTLHMVDAFSALGLRTTLYLPPWPRTVRLQRRLHDFGIDRPLDIRASQGLHSRWKGWPFVWLHRRRLQRADAVYVRSPEISLLLCRSGVPHHLEIHETEWLKPEQLATLVSAHRAGLIRWLLPISRAAENALIEAGASAERTLLVPSGVNLAAFAGIPPYQPVGKPLPHVVYPGRLSRDRGLGIFEALAERRQAEIILLGEQDDVPLASDWLKVLPFAPHREIPAWYGRTDFVLLPYQTDLRHSASISPIKLFEAMAAGRPIIASDLPAIREILEHEKNALLVSPGDVDAWSAALGRLQGDPDLACRLARAAKEKSAEFGWDQRALKIARTCGWIA